MNCSACASQQKLSAPRRVMRAGGWDMVSTVAEIRAIGDRSFVGRLGVDSGLMAGLMGWSDVMPASHYMQNRTLALSPNSGSKS